MWEKLNASFLTKEFVINDCLTMNYDAKHLAISCERISSKKPDLKNVQNAEQIILGKCKNWEN